VRVRSAHVSTLGANAVDAFYVTDGDGEPLPPHQATEGVQEVEKQSGRRPAPAPFETRNGRGLCVLRGPDTLEGD
jgi:hypothetical protein